MTPDAATPQEAGVPGIHQVATLDVTAQHDVLLFVATTTWARPTPTGYRKLPV